MSIFSLIIWNFYSISHESYELLCEHQLSIIVRYMNMNELHFTDQEIHTERDYAACPDSLEAHWKGWESLSPPVLLSGISAETKAQVLVESL